MRIKLKNRDSDPRPRGGAVAPGFSSWDALIAAAAQGASCRYLLTEDLQPGQELEGVMVVNPFRTNFPSLE